LVEYCDIRAVEREEAYTYDYVLSAWLEQSTDIRPNEGTGNAYVSIHKSKLEIGDWRLEMMKHTHAFRRPRMSNALVSSFLEHSVTAQLFKSHEPGLDEKCSV
jgi:hypothetical protein